MIINWRISFHWTLVYVVFAKNLSYNKWLLTAAILYNSVQSTSVTNRKNTKVQWIECTNLLLFQISLFMIILYVLPTVGPCILHILEPKNPHYVKIALCENQATFFKYLVLMAQKQYTKSSINATSIVRSLQ